MDSLHSCGIHLCMSKSRKTSQKSLEEVQLCLTAGERSEPAVNSYPSHGLVEVE